MALYASLTGKAAGLNAAMSSLSSANSAFSAGESPALTSVGAIISSGAINGEISWTLSDEGELVLSGSGATGDFVVSPFVEERIESEITSVVIGEGITKLGDHFFDGCVNLTSISLPSTFSGIGEGVFDDCKALNKLNITDVKAWCSVSFDDEFYNPLYYAKNLYVNGVEATDLVIPEDKDFTNISKFAFYGCQNVKSVSIPVTLRGIAVAAFKACPNLDKVYITDLESWCKMTFSAAESNPLNNNQSKLYLNGEEVTNLAVPDDAAISSIAKYAFYNCSSLTSASFSNVITSIENEAFKGCKNLVTLTLPESITTIKPQAFSGCSKLTTVSLPSKITKVDANVFEDCSSLTYVSLPEKLEIINSRAFAGCSTLASIVLPGTLTSIYANAFNGCSSLSSITVPNSVTFIGNYAFNGCIALETVTLPSSLETFSEAVFKDCCKLKTLTLPSSLTQIKKECFSGCTSLSSITIPASVTNIADKAFYGCLSLYEVRNLSSLDVQMGEVTNGYVAYYAKGVLVSADEPSIYYSESDFSFCREDGLYRLIAYTGTDKYLSLPAKCNGENYSINAGALNGKEFSVIVLPESVVSIATNALQGTTFKALVCQGNTPAIMGDGNLAVGQRVIVPGVSIDAYKDAWGASCNILPVVDVMFLEKVDAAAYASRMASEDKMNVTSVAFYGEGLADDLTATLLKDGMNPNCLYLVPTGTKATGGNIVDFESHTAKSVVLTDGYAYGSPIKFRASHIKYVHNPSVWATGKSGWETLVLPFEATEFEASLNGSLFPILRGSTGDFWVRKYIGSNAKNVYFSSLDEAVMQAQTPYLVAFPGETMGVGHLQGQTITFGATEADVAVTVVPSLVRNQFTFVGNYDTIEDGVTGYVLNDSGSSFVKDATAGKNPFQAYFVNKNSSSDVKSLGITFGEFNEETGLFEVEGPDVTNGFGNSVYDLSGRKTQNAGKGIYIVNGKKVVKL